MESPKGGSRECNNAINDSIWCYGCHALQILEDLLQENDQSVHLYFLLAMAHFAGGDKETALEFITEGEELMSRLGVPGGDAAAKGFQTLKVQQMELCLV